MLSILLLRLRDRKTRGFRKKGLLPQLYREIALAAAEDIGRYSDSDDESDEEDDEEFVVTRREKKPAEVAAAAVEVALKPSKLYLQDASPDSDDEPSEPAPKPAENRRASVRKSKRVSQIASAAAKAARRKSATPAMPSKMSVFVRSESLPSDLAMPPIFPSFVTVQQSCGEFDSSFGQV